MDVVNTILIVVWAISSVFMSILILMHSGKGTGVSDMIAASMYKSAVGSGIWERNLDRLTVIVALIFGIVLVAMMFTLPLGSISH